MALKHPRAKGRIVQNKLITLLQQGGYDVAVIERTGRFIKVKDAYGCFDLLALSEDGDMILAQVTSTRPHGHKKFLEFAKKYWRTKVSIRQYVWRSYYGFYLYVYTRDGYTRHKLY